jgi:hypothetical protein
MNRWRLSLPTRAVIPAIFVILVVFRDLFKRDDLSLFHIAVLPLCLWALVSDLLIRRPPRPLVKQNLVWAFVWLAALSSWFFHRDPNLWLLYMGWLAFGFMTFYVSRDLMIGRNGALFLAANLAVFVAGLGVACYELMTGNHLPSSRLVDHEGAFLFRMASGPLYNPNDFALYLVLFLSICAPFVRSRTMTVALIGVTAMVMPFTMSTAGLVALAVWGTTYFSLYFRRVWLLIPAGLMMAVFVFPDPRVSEVFELDKIRAFLTLSTDYRAGGYSAADRSTLVLIAWDEFRHCYWFGLGAGGVSATLNAAGNEIVYLHNFVLEILFNFGVIVFSIVSIAFIVAVRLLYRASRDPRLSPHTQRFAASLCGSLLCMPIAGAAPGLTTYVSPFWMWLGIVAGVGVQLAQLRAAPLAAAQSIPGGAHPQAMPEPRLQPA